MLSGSAISIECTDEQKILQPFNPTSIQPIRSLPWNILKHLVDDTALIMCTIDHDFAINWTKLNT